MALDGDLAAYSRLCLDTLLARPIGLLSILEEEVKFPSANKSRWFSVGFCKYKPGYKSHKVKCSHWLKLQHLDWRANLIKYFFRINFPPMRALEIKIGYVTYNPAYT